MKIIFFYLALFIGTIVATTDAAPRGPDNALGKPSLPHLKGGKGKGGVGMGKGGKGKGGKGKGGMTKGGTGKGGTGKGGTGKGGMGKGGNGGNEGMAVMAARATAMKAKANAKVKTVAMTREATPSLPN
jgi:hypothetical protein